jgi:hypothetical protein
MYEVLDLWRVDERRNADWEFTAASQSAATQIPIKLVREEMYRVLILHHTHIYIVNYYMSWLLDWLNMVR